MQEHIHENDLRHAEEHIQEGDLSHFEEFSLVSAQCIYFFDFFRRENFWPGFLGFTLLLITNMLALGELLEKKQDHVKTL